MIKISSGLALTVVLAGCATPYQEMGFSGGVQAVQITSDTFQISARGNEYTDPEMIERYALRKAAEVVLAAGYDMFVVGDKQDRSLAGSETIGTVSGGRYSLWGSSSTWQTLKPGQALWVRGLKYPAPDPAPQGLYDAREVLKFLGAATSDSKTCQVLDGAVICK